LFTNDYAIEVLLHIDSVLHNGSLVQTHWKPFEIVTQGVRKRTVYFKFIQLNSLYYQDSWK